MARTAGHPGRVRPLDGPQGWVKVDGRPICVVCGRGVRPTGPDRWRHVPRGQRGTGRSKWLSPVTIEDLRRITTYEEFGDRYPWAVHADFGGRSVTTEEDWQEGVRRLEAYHTTLARFDGRHELDPGDNPLLDLVGILSAPPGPATVAGPTAHPARRPGIEPAWPLPGGLHQMLDLAQRRRELASRFAWAIPSGPALEVLARHAPLLECGAGTGYWAALLRARGVDVVAYDHRPPGRDRANRYHRTAQAWTDVRAGTSVAAVRRHRDRVLFLCWPPLDNDGASYAPVRAYRGDVLLYVGEGGAQVVTGTVRFHRELRHNWTLVAEVALPTWPWLRDRLMVYRRNPTRRPLVERDRCFDCGRFVPTGWIGRCDWCFEHRPVALALKVGDHRVEYPEELLATFPPALRLALQQSPNRLR